MQPHISPMAHFQTTKQNKKSSFHIFPHGCLLIIDTHIIPLKYHLTSNLPTFTLVTKSNHNNPAPTPPLVQHLSSETTNLLHGFVAEHSQLPLANTYRTTPEQLQNLTAMQRQLYNWHIRLGHMNFATIQSMARKDLGLPQELAQCTPPVCQECLFGKAKQRSLQNLWPIGEWPFTTRRNVLCRSNDCRLQWPTIYHAWSPI